MAEKLKEILENYLNGESFKEINETITLENAWKEVVGNLINKNTQIISFKNKTLTVKTTTPVWRNELFLQKPKINKYISDIRMNIAELTFLDVKKISVKATTTDYLGFIGENKGIACITNVLIQNVN